MNGVSIDLEANAAYLALADMPVARTVDHGSFVADYASDGQVIGIEVLALQRPLRSSDIVDVLGPVGEVTGRLIAHFIDQIQAASARTQHSPQQPMRSRASLEDVKFLAVAEVAAIMHVSKMTVYRMIHSGALPAIRVGRSYRVPERAVLDYIREQFTKSPAAGQAQAGRHSC